MNLRLLGQSQASLPAATTPQAVCRLKRVLCGNRTRLARLETWSLCRSAKSTRLSFSGRRGSRTLKAGYPRSGWLDRFRSGCHRQLACPSVFMFTSCGGRNRTCVRAVNSRLPVPARVPPQSFTQSGWLDLNQRSRAPEAGGFPDFPIRATEHRPRAWPERRAVVQNT